MRYFNWRFDFISFYYCSTLCYPPNIIETRLFNFTHKVKMTGLYFATSVQISTLLTNWSHGKLKTVGSDSAGLTQSGSLNVNTFFIFCTFWKLMKVQRKKERKRKKVYFHRPLIFNKVCLEKYQTFEKFKPRPHCSELKRIKIKRGKKNKIFSSTIPQNKAEKI